MELIMWLCSGSSADEGNLKAGSYYTFRPKSVSSWYLSAVKKKNQGQKGVPLITTLDVTDFSTM